jgi:hypothetical protein
MWDGRLMIVALAACAIALGASPARARDVKRCGITIGAGKTGTLVKDVECGYRCSADSTVRCVLDDEVHRCPGDPTQGCVGETILLERNATLDLNGFTLRGARWQTVVECAASPQGKCTVQGPGRLEAPKGRPVLANDQDVVLRDLTIVGAYERGVETAGRVWLENFTMEDCVDASITAGRRLRAQNVRLDAGCFLSSQGNISADGIVTAYGFSAAGNVRASNVVTRSGTIRGKNVTLQGAQVPAPLPDSMPTFYSNVTAVKRLVLRDATVGAIVSGVKPSVLGASCLRSRKLGTRDSWGVCSGE